MLSQLSDTAVHRGPHPVLIRETNSHDFFHEGRFRNMATFFGDISTTHYNVNFSSCSGRILKLLGVLES